MDAAVNTDAATEAGVEDRVGRLAAGLVAVAALVWLVASLVTAHSAILGNADVPAVALGAAAFALPILVTAALVAGAAVGLVAADHFQRRGFQRRGLQRRGFQRRGFQRGGRSVPARPEARGATAARRVVAGLAAGAVLGAVCAGLVVYGYGTFGQVAALAGTVAAAAVLGSAAAVLPSPVLASGLVATLGVLLLGLVAGLAEPRLVGLLGGGATLDSQVTAGYALAYLVGVAGGVLAGAVAFWFLRRHGSRAWPWYLLAGVLPGLLLLAAELVARVGGASLIEIVRSLSDGDRYAVDVGAFSRLRNAMVVTFVGGLAAMVAVGRTLRAVR